MKTITKTVMMVGISTLAMLSAPAFAADAPAAAGPVTFGIVDMNKVMQTTDVAKDIFAQMEVKRKEFQTQIAKEGEPLGAAEQDLVKQKDSLPKDAFEEKFKALQQKELQEQKVVDERKRILDLAFNNALGKLRHEAAAVVAGVAKERHYSAVFTQDAVMISTPDLDMTDDVLSQMNKNVKKITVDWAAATAAASAAAAPADGAPAKKK